MSPVIILGLVLMWACVLVPMWLRRHDEAEQDRSVDRFSTAMHTLSRREARADERYVVMPHRTRSMDVHVSGASAPDAGISHAAAAAPGRPSGRSLPARLIGAALILGAAGVGMARRAATLAVAVTTGCVAVVLGSARGHERRPLTPAMRRRRTLIGLVVAAVVTLVLAVAVGGVLAWLLQITVDVALGAFVRHLRQRALRAAAVARQRRRAAAAPVAMPDAEPLRRSAYATRPEPVVFSEPAAAPGAAAAAPVAAETAEAVAGSWEPVPVPRPTYTMKPPAPARPPRTVEYADYSEPLVPRADERDDLDDTADLGAILEQRWAVND